MGGTVMALPERTFGPSLNGPSVYRDTSNSEWVDGTSADSSLFIPGGDFVLEAEYERLGPDLFLSGEDRSVFVKGYFTHEEAPDLYTSDGHAVVRGSVATRLAGPNTPGQFAQAEAVPGIQPIGIVDNAEGRVFLSRLDGSNVLAEPGTPVFLGDIVETEGGASVGIVFAGWLVSKGGEGQKPGPLVDPDPMNIVPRTAKIAESARLPFLEWGREPMHLGILLAIVAVIVIWWVIWKTPFGFGLRMVGLNPSAARYAGVNVAHSTIVTMAIAGGLAGMAGTVETLGRNYYFAPNFNVGYGFDSIAIALLGRNHPVGVVLSALLFGVMDAGSTRMQLSAHVPSEIIKVVQALILAFVAANEIIRYIYRIRAPREGDVVPLSAGWGKR